MGDRTVNIRDFKRAAKKVGKSKPKGKACKERRRLLDRED